MRDPLATRRTIYTTEVGKSYRRNRQIRRDRHIDTNREARHAGETDTYGATDIDTYNTNLLTSIHNNIVFLIVQTLYTTAWPLVVVVVQEASVSKFTTGFVTMSWGDSEVTT